MKLFSFKKKFKEHGEKIVNLFNKNRFINVDDKNRSDTKVVQVVIFAFMMSLIFNAMLVCLILILLPLKEKVPYFVHFMPREEQIVYVDEYKENKKSQRVIKEFLARNYVKKRETIDQATETDRYAEVTFLSTAEIKNSFISEYKENPNSPYKTAVDNGSIRTINIITSSVLSNDQYQVEFEMIDTKKNTGEILETSIAVATVTFIDNKNNYKGNNYLNNPFGYLVSDYSVGIKEKRIENNFKEGKKEKDEKVSTTTASNTSNNW